MNDSINQLPTPITGQLIRLSRAKYWLETSVMLGSSAICLIGIGLDPFVQGVTWALAVPVVLSRIRAFVLLGQVIRDQRLVIGTNRLQLLERAGDVLGDIPFAEIEDATVPAHGPYAGRLVISLYPREGEATRWPAPTWPRRTYLKRLQGREAIIVEPFFTEGSASIQERLLNRLDRYIDSVVYGSVQEVLPAPG